MWPGGFFLTSAHTSPAHLSVIGGDFVLESVVRCAAFVRYSEFGGCPLFGSIKCTASTGIAVGTSTVVRYSEEVRYWEGPLSEVPLYIGVITKHEKCILTFNTIINTSIIPPIHQIHYRYLINYNILNDTITPKQFTCVMTPAIFEEG